MQLEASYHKYILDFKFDAGTSRGVLKQKETFFIKIWHQDHPDIYGLGECGPLKKLSVDDVQNLEQVITDTLKKLTRHTLPLTVEAVYELADALVDYHYPALRFGLETALLDLLHGGKRMIYDNEFYHGNTIPINGLIWMGHMEHMLKQVTDKVDQGFDCIKMKIGSLDFEKECDILEYIRRKYFDKDIVLRVDANGAFKPSEAMNKLTALSHYELHSIEQPIAPGQADEMARLCKDSPVPIALDEELIGIEGNDEKRRLLSLIKPPYIILKPTLVGGFKSCLEWIEFADELGIGWWLTSALESNIGLNAICQFATELAVKGHQGLGTGQLYHNNIPSPLSISNGRIQYLQQDHWDLNIF